MAQLIIPHPGQTTILKSKARFRVVACGRRFGKTALGQIAIVEAASEGARCWWLSPTYKMASQVWRDLKRACRTRDEVEINNDERRIDFVKGGWLAIRSTHSADNLRGAGLDLAVLDEAAFMAADVWPEVVRPMLLERQGKALFLSSPNGRNWFWELFQRGLDPHEPEWQSFHFTSYDNPLIAPAELDAIRRQTPERVWQQEYLAQFSEDSGLVFRGLRDAATAPPDAQPQAGTRYVIGCDWGRSGDYTALVVLDADRRQMVAMDRFNQINWSLQRGRLRALYDHWQPVVIWAESNSIGSVNIEALQAEGLPVRPFATTVKSKGPLIEDLALALERRDLALLPDETLLHELAAYSLERLPGGTYRYSAPLGQHDDTVIALALAWHGVRHGGAGVEFV
ncbi:MAG: hypothetical protein HZC41_20035 [Chloroflexi bacterium]|nr:hypothetical protein [Chloroflexota bacterium]